MAKFEFEGEEDRRKAKAKKKSFCIEWRYNPPAEVLEQSVFSKPFDWTPYRRYGTKAARDQAFESLMTDSGTKSLLRTKWHYEYRKGEGKK
jgi:hypothetical protein